jgi:outer membrane beta-barrel protein
MENWNKRVFLAAALCGMGSGPAIGETEGPVDQVVYPDIERREIPRDAIDTEDFELGPYAGIISIQDFNSEVVYGLRGAWHVSEDFFFEASYGTSKADLTSYEKLSGGAPLFSDEERDYSYYNLSLGWNAFPGEVFLLDKYAFKSDFYFIGGAGSTEFLGDNWFTVTLGAGYRLLLNDAVAWRLDIRDHIYDREAFGTEETTNNIEWSTGLTIYF